MPPATAQVLTRCLEGSLVVVGRRKAGAGAGVSARNTAQPAQPPKRCVPNAPGSHVLLAPDTLAGRHAASRTGLEGSRKLQWCGRRRRWTPRRSPPTAASAWAASVMGARPTSCSMASARRSMLGPPLPATRALLGEPAPSCHASRGSDLVAAVSKSTESASLATWPGLTFVSSAAPTDRHHRSGATSTGSATHALSNINTVFRRPGCKARLGCERRGIP